MKIYNGAGTGKSRRNGRTGPTLNPHLQDTKVQRKIPENNTKFEKIYAQNSGIFYAFSVRPLRRAHTAASWAKMLLIYAFVIRIYSQLQHQLHKQLDVTRHKSTFRIYV
jgi:hypothetical protein